MKNSVRGCSWLFLLLLPLLAQSTITKRSNVGGITLSGIVLDERLTKNPNFKSQIHIYASRYPFSQIEIVGLPHERYDITYNAGDTFHLYIPDTAKNVFLHISYDLPKGYISEYNWIDNIYLVNNGDSIFSQLADDKRSRTFTGRGAKKIQCQNDIYRLKYNPTSEERSLLTDIDTYLGGLDNIYKKMDSSLWLQINLVAKNKDNLGKDLTQVLFANCIGLQYFDFLRGQYIANLRNPIYLREFMKSKIYKSIQSINSHSAAASNFATAPIYGSFLYQREIISSLIRDLPPAAPFTQPSRFQQLFEYFYSNYSGSLKEKMLTLVLLRLSQSDPRAIATIPKILNESKDPLYKEALKTIYNARGQGKYFGDFTLSNTEDKKVKLSEYYNKVLIIDFWYTGCTPCMKLNQSMQPIYKQFENDSNVIFISISIDKNKDNWLKSLRGGKYTNPKGVHLFTSGMGSNHPIITEKLIRSYPTMFILLRDKLLTSAPPRPINKKNEEELIKQIDNAVSQLKSNNLPS